MSGLVLIAYDGSDHAKAAIGEAGRQLEPGRPALVLTISEPIERLPFLGAAGVAFDADSMETLFEAATSGAEKTAAEGAELARAAGFEAEPLAITGGPAWDQIVATADQRDADLIVLGSRGRSGIKYAVLGSVAAAVVQHSKRTVLVTHSSV
ncbi:MAG TPA: universal stress protein [Solirubrobacterales bacterium]|nr:universal stress protein [Solirubrobacterales bacterium]